MKKFIISVLCVAIFFIGLGGLLKTVGAKFKSDEKALTLIRQAREAIGGDANLNNVRSFSATGKISKTLNFEAQSRVEQGEWELNLQLPNQMSRAMRLGKNDGTGERREFIRKDNVVVIKKGDGEDKNFVIPEPANGGEKKIVVIQKNDGEPTILQGDKASGELKKLSIDKNIRLFEGGADKIHQTDMFRMTLALLLTAPENIDVSYTYAGEATIDGVSCEIIESGNGDSTVKLFLDKSSHLPKMISFQAAKPMILHFKKDDANPNADKRQNFIIQNKELPEMAKFQIKFSDYRNVNGVQMPFRWTQTIGGNADETIDITAYEINPANIQEKFNQMPQKVLFRTAKPQ